MVPVFLKQPLLDMASSIWAMPKKEWIDDAPNSRDIQLMINESESVSEIDERNFRKEMIDMWKEMKVDMRVKELPGITRVIFLGTDEQWSKIPWFLWSLIFQAVGHKVEHILFFAHPSKRFFPTNGHIGPENINGGYTNLCSQDKIVIYRFEEVSRVLLHELLHTSCLDTEKDVVMLEAYTEAWTELFLCAILSMGNPKEFGRLWKQQCQWIMSQCYLLSEKYAVNGPDDYAWRYINGKRDVLNGLGFYHEYIEPYETKVTLRFTTPDWAI